MSESHRLIAYSRGFVTATSVVIDAIEPVAHVSRGFEITGMRLADYEKRPTPSIFQNSIIN